VKSWSVPEEIDGSRLQTGRDINIDGKRGLGEKGTDLFLVVAMAE